MAKQPFYPSIDEDRYINTTHRLNLTGAQISTILYCLEGYVAGLDDCIPQEGDEQLVKDVDDIFAELQSVTDNYYAQLEEGRL